MDRQSEFIAEMLILMKKFDVVLVDFDHHPHFCSSANNIDCSIFEFDTHDYSDQGPLEH